MYQHNARPSRWAFESTGKPTGSQKINKDIIIVFIVFCFFLLSFFKITEEEGEFFLLSQPEENVEKKGINALLFHEKPTLMTPHKGQKKKTKKKTWKKKRAEEKKKGHNSGEKDKILLPLFLGYAP